MLAVDIRILGDKELERALARLEPDLQRKIVRSAGRKGGKIIQADAKRRAPRQTGRMADSIKIKSRSSKKKGVSVTVQTGDRPTLGIAADDPYYYPAAVEFGHGTVAARPFLRPALETNRPQVIQAIAEDIRSEVRKVGRK